MKKTQPLLVQELPKGGNPYFWLPERVPHCPKAACRRAGRCVRPRIIEGRWPYGWSSCPLLTDDEWVPWAKVTFALLKKRLWELDEAKLAAQREAERQAKRRRR
jgi:hypothetical protein